MLVFSSGVQNLLPGDAVVKGAHIFLNQFTQPTDPHGEQILADERAAAFKAVYFNEVDTRNFKEKFPVVAAHQEGKCRHVDQGGGRLARSLPRGQPEFSRACVCFRAMSEAFANLYIPRDKPSRHVDTGKGRAARPRLSSGHGGQLNVQNDISNAGRSK